MNRGIFNPVRKSPIRWRDGLKIVVAFIAVSSAHFLGFISLAPDPLKPLIASSLAPAFFFTLTYYVLFFLLLSRLLAHGLLFAKDITSLTQFFDSKKTKIRKAKDFIERPSLDDLFVLIAQILIFTLLFLRYYLDFVGLFIAIFFIPIIAVFSYSAAIRLAGYGSLKRLVEHTRGSRPSRVQAARLNSLVTLGTIGALALAYGTGSLRMGKVWRSNEVLLESPVLSGYFNVALRSGTDYLVVEQCGFFDRYIFVTATAVFAEPIYSADMPTSCVDLRQMGLSAKIHSESPTPGSGSSAERSSEED